MDDRSKYLGGTDCAAVLGLSRYKTVWEIWAEKTGRIEPTDISQKLSVRLGHKLEQTVADLFMEETGKKVVRKNDTMYHRKYPFLGVNLDRRVVGEDAVLECKTANSRYAAQWDEEEIPIEYLCQVNHQLLVTGAKYAYIAVLIGGNEKFIWKKIDRDENLLQSMETKLVHFWQTFVEGDIPPDPASITYKDGDVLYRMFPNTQNEADPVQLTDEANKLVESIRAMDTDMKAIARQIDADKNRLKALLGENATGTTGLYKITWKKVHKDAYTVAESDSRQLRIYDVKGE